MRVSHTYGFRTLNDFLAGLPDKVDQIAEDLLEAHSNWMSRRMRRHISAQDMGWAKNRPMTIDRKGHGIVMVETGGYFKSIGIHDQNTSGTKKEARIGPGSGKTERTGVPYTQIGIWLEFGTKTQPPRPLFRPLLKEWKAGFPRVLLPIAKRRL